MIPTVESHFTLLSIFILPFLKGRYVTNPKNNDHENILGKEHRQSLYYKTLLKTTPFEVMSFLRKTERVNYSHTNLNLDWLLKFMNLFGSVPEG